ncbi:glycosyltransferase family 1 protein [Acidipropionibacterium jensenii]|uniref:glycosyltransferase family 1 protein n=1 Tax=Acidipropionibacterium jensenii TaxID=1749 RepID=UPI00214C9FC0|nr:glycosyltransferase family 1 protein [Acidipropionibacterium jensenii]
MLTVPAGHPYVSTSIGPVERVDDGVLVLPDVLPADRPDGQWWPPVALDPSALSAWLGAKGHPSGRRIDVVHVHFGFEGIGLDDLDACLALLEAHDVPLALTVHDLRNPHVEQDDQYAPRLDRLVRAADVLLTLTPAAAGQVRAQWGRDCLVIPHPHVAPLDRIATVAGPRPRSGPLRVGLSMKSLRANTLSAVQVAEVADMVLAAGAVLEVGVHREALDAGFVRHDPAMATLLERLDDTDGITVTVHDRLDDEAYLDGLARHDVLVLPYRFGTHSGVLEACRDVGTIAVAPSVGCYTSQAHCPEYDPDDITGTLPSALAEATRMLAGDSAADGWFVDRRGRTRQAAAVRRAHRDAYATAVAAATTRSRA